MDVDELEEEKARLRPTAKKQNLLLEVLMTLEGDRVSAKSLKEDYGLQLQTLRSGEKKGWLKIFDQRVRRDPYQDREFTPTEAKAIFFPSTAEAYQAVEESMDKQGEECLSPSGVDRQWEDRSLPPVNSPCPGTGEDRPPSCP